MPKRIPTPPPPDDEPRYLTVVHPYPLHANLMIHADRRTLALWLACCTGKDVLLAMYFKPTSQGMVIIEVDRDFDRFEDLLGLHSWSKFLLRPLGEEQDKESKVFWCHYNSGRSVQKHGWKRVDIEEHWFKGWSPNNSKIVCPYPKTTWCDVPSEAKTGVPLCRPLPQAHFPTPQSAPRATVGSAAWIRDKSSDTSSVVTSSSRKKDNRSIAPSDSVSMISSASSGTTRGAKSPRAPASVASTVSTAWRIGEFRARQDGLSRGPPSVASIASPPGLRAPSTIGSRAHSSRSSAGPLARPPGLSLQYEHFDWGDEVDRVELEQEDRCATPSAISASFKSGPRGSNVRRRHDPEGPIDPDQDYEYEEDDRPKRSIVDAMNEVFDRDSDDEMIQNWRHDTQGMEDDDPWIAYDAPRWEPPTKVNKKGGEEWKCPDHGPMCNPGICKERARVERERRWQKEHEERQEAKRIRDEKREITKLKKDIKEAKAEGRELSYDIPPHLAHAVKWVKDSSDSGSDSNGSTGGEATGEEGSQAGAGADDHEHPPPPTSVYGEDMWATRSDWGDNDDDDDDDYGAPKVNIVRRTPSIVSTEYDERGQGPPPSLPAYNARSAKTSYSTTSANMKDNRSNVSQSTNANRQPPRDARSAASSRTPARSVWEDDVTSAKSGWHRQPVRTPSVPSSVSERPTRSYAASVSQSSSTTGRRAPEGDSRSSKTLLDPVSNTAAGGRRAPPTSTTRSSTSTSARTAVSTESTPPEGGFPVFGDTKWGDPITAAQYERSKKKKKSGGSRVGKKGSDGDGENESSDVASEVAATNQSANQSEQNAASGVGSGKKNDGGWRTKGRGGGKNKFAAKVKRGGGPKPQSDTLSVVLDIDLPPGGPGSKWGEPNEEW